MPHMAFFVSSLISFIIIITIYLLLPLRKVFINTYLKQIMFLGYTVLQLFWGYNTQYM